MSSAVIYLWKTQILLPYTSILTQFHIIISFLSFAFGSYTYKIHSDLYESLVLTYRSLLFSSSQLFLPLWCSNFEELWILEPLWWWHKISEFWIYLGYVEQSCVFPWEFHLRQRPGQCHIIMEEKINKNCLIFTAKVVLLLHLDYVVSIEGCKSLVSRQVQ